MPETSSGTGTLASKPVRSNFSTPNTARIAAEYIRIGLYTPKTRKLFFTIIVAITMPKMPSGMSASAELISQSELKYAKPIQPQHIPAP